MSKNLIALQNRFLGRGDTVYDRLARLVAETGQVTPADVDRLAAELSLPAAHIRSVAQFYDELRVDRPAAQVRVRVCNGEACVAAGAEACKRTLQTELAGSDAEVGEVTCVGYCGSGPNVLVETESAVSVVGLDDASRSEVVAVARNGKLPDLPEPTNEVHPPVDPERAVLLRSFCEGDAASIEVALEVGAYAVAAHALAEPAERILAAVERSGLRGRGGAGFPTGAKLAAVARADAHGAARTIVLNADEGDAGAYIDKELIERAPHTVIEGMILAAHAVGASDGIVYLRGEYPRAHVVLGRALAAARDAGWLGADIRRSGMAFDIRIVRGHGAYVCGEETALLRSLEGVPAQVTPKPPYPAEQGLRGAPTLVSNVETIANLPFIVADGGEAFAALGHGRSRGTKLVSLNKAVVRPGLYEVELGTTLRTILFDLAGGMADGRKFKAVQVGGPLGGIFAERHLDLPLDFDVLSQAGGLLGHAGMIVFSDADDLVAVGRGLMKFCAVESCGKCFPCRLGSVRGTELFDRMLAGEAGQGEVELLAELSETMRVGSLCALGGGIPVPIDNLLGWFPEEFARHVPNAQVPARLAAPDAGAKR